VSVLNVVGTNEKGQAVCKHQRPRHGCPDCRIELTGSERQRRWRSDYPHRALAIELRAYGVTVEWYAEQERKQQGLCAICGQPETSTRNGKVKRLAVDHDHVTGVARALLCCKCNQWLGVIEMSEWIAKASAYLATFVKQVRPRDVFDDQDEPSK
jgi:hypothetical protein